MGCFGDMSERPVRRFVRVPQTSQFFGIVVAMYHDDHPPPHFHVRYGADPETALTIWLDPSR